MKILLPGQNVAHQLDCTYISLTFNSCSSEIITDMLKDLLENPKSEVIKNNALWERLQDRSVLVLNISPKTISDKIIRDFYKSGNYPQVGESLLQKYSFNEGEYIPMLPIEDFYPAEILFYWKNKWLSENSKVKIFVSGSNLYKCSDRNLDIDFGSSITRDPYETFYLKGYTESVSSAQELPKKNIFSWSDKSDLVNRVVRIISDMPDPRDELKSKRR